MLKAMPFVEEISKLDSAIWYPVEMDKKECSACGHKMHLLDDGYFCPRCGAKMLNEREIFDLC